MKKRKRKKKGKKKGNIYLYKEAAKWFSERKRTRIIISVNTKCTIVEQMIISNVKKN